MLLIAGLVVRHKVQIMVENQITVVHHTECFCPERMSSVFHIANRMKQQSEEKGLKE